MSSDKTEAYWVSNLGMICFGPWPDVSFCELWRVFASSLYFVSNGVAGELEYQHLVQRRFGTGRLSLH